MLCQGSVREKFTCAVRCAHLCMCASISRRIQRIASSVNEAFATKKNYPKKMNYVSSQLHDCQLDDGLEYHVHPVLVRTYVRGRSRRVSGLARFIHIPCRAQVSRTQFRRQAIGSLASHPAALPRASTHCKARTTDRQDAAPAPNSDATAWRSAALSLWPKTCHKST